MGVLKLLFGFNGRINRAQYWLGNLGAGVGIFMLMFVLMVVGGAPAPSMSDEQQLAHFLAMFGIAIIPAALLGSWCGLALQWKRFHDRGKSGVWVFLPMLPSFMMFSSLFGAIAAGAHPSTVAASAQPWATILWLVQLWYLVELGFLPGKDGPNKYGDTPGGASYSAPKAPAGGTDHAIPGMKSALGSAESAIDRAIAARTAPPQRPAPAAQRPLSPAPAMSGLRPATAGSFGRKVTP